MMPKPKFNRVKLKAYKLTNTYENRKFVFSVLNAFLLMKVGS